MPSQYGQISSLSHGGGIPAHGGGDGGIGMASGGVASLDTSSSLGLRSLSVGMLSSFGMLPSAVVSSVFFFSMVSSVWCRLQV